MEKDQQAVPDLHRCGSPVQKISADECHSLAEDWMELFVSSLNKKAAAAHREHVEDYKLFRST